MPPPPFRLLPSLAMGLALALSACATRGPTPTSAPAQALPAPPPPATTPGTFTLEAVPLDVWNAIGDVVVRTPQASYDSRSQMLGLYSVRYRGEPLLVLAHALPLSDTIHVLTTEVTARAPNGAPLDSDAAAGLLAVLQRELPAEVQAVRARQAAEAKAASATPAKHKRAHKASHKQAKR